MTDKPITFGIIGADHNHIFGMTAGMMDAGAVLKGWWTKEEPPTMPPTTLGVNLYADKPFPMAPRVQDRRQLLEDPEVDLILVCAIPGDRAALSVEAMRHGKDVMSDKPAAITLEEMAEIRRAMDETGRIWTVNFSERNHVRAMIKAGEMVQQGTIGKVVQMIGLGPHRTVPTQRPDWFFDPKRSGGVMGFMASHQLDHFLYYTGSNNAEVVASNIGNFRYPQYPIFEDFGDLMLRGDGGLGYIQVTWYSPDSHSHPGDNRLLLVGTEGQIEVRKYVDIGGRPAGNHLFLMTDNRSEHIDTSDVKLVFFKQLIKDIRERTWTAQPREHSLVASELAIKAANQAVKLGNLA